MGILQLNTQEVDLPVPMEQRGGGRFGPLGLAGVNVNLTALPVLTALTALTVIRGYVTETPCIIRF